jgi:hypothetical protein
VLAQKNATLTIATLAQKLRIELKKTAAKEAKLIGKMQYPSKETLYKIETFPPSNLQFKVITKEPPQIKEKIVANITSAIELINQ